MQGRWSKRRFFQSPSRAEPVAVAWPWSDSRRLSLTLTHNACKCVYSRLQKGNGCKRSICRRRKRTSINLKGPGILKNDRGVEGIAQALSVSLGSLPTNSALLLRPETAGLNFGWDWSSLLWNFINFIVQRQSWNSGVCRKVALVSTYYKSDDVEKITEDILGRRQIFLEKKVHRHSRGRGIVTASHRKRGKYELKPGNTTIGRNCVEVIYL